MLFLVFLFSFCVGAKVQTAPLHIMTQDKAKSVREGFYVGGQVQTVTSLLNIYRQTFKKSTKERWIFSLGNEKQAPLRDHLPYVQVNVDSKRNRLVVEFFQLNQSRIKIENIKKMVKRSKHIKSSKLLFDPMDSTTSLVLVFKKPSLVKVFHNKTKLGPLAFEISPLTEVKKNINKNL